jgi:L-ascorbate metabolism protein UlaG (beta-lactamase superfamily)
MRLTNHLSRLIPAGLLISVPFLDLVDPLERISPQTHQEKRWKRTYDQPLEKDQIQFRWLGTTGFHIQKGDFNLLIDPYLTRIPLPQLYLVPLEPNKKISQEKIPKADYIFVTDSHFDHFLDVPEIAKRTGAKVVGSATSAQLLRVHKVPEDQIIQVDGGEVLQAGPFTVRIAKATHGAIWFFQPFYGDADETAHTPLSVWQYTNRENRCYQFQTEGFSFFATSGSDLRAEDISGWEVDLVIANVTSLAPGYIEKILKNLKPKVVFPTHYDNFFEPYSKGVQPFPILDLKIFCQEIERQDPNISIVTLDFFQDYRSEFGGHTP